MRRPDTVPEGTLDRTTPVPNVLIDTFLPHLSDTELRVLLVVDRATLGWKDGQGRKESDWLSHRQLQARTGRAGASVSHAIETLVQRGLLIVQDGSGRARDSAHSRRATRGRLYYRLSATLLAPQHATTTSTPISEEHQGHQTASTPVLRVQKVKTTKETGTKEKEPKMSSLKTEVEPINLEPTDVEPREVNAPPNIPKGVAIGTDKAIHDDDLEADDLEQQAEHFIGMFARAYRLARPDQAMPPVEDADRTLLQGCLKQTGAPVLEAWLPAFFSSSFGYARRRDWSLGCYLNCLFILQAQAGSNPLCGGRWQRATGDGSKPH